MKIAVLFLTLFVGASYQQGYNWGYNYALPYYPGMFNLYQQAFPAPAERPSFEQNIEGRSKQQKDAVEGRLFGSGQISFTNPFSIATTVTSTLTAYAITTTSTTAISISLISCVVSTFFTSTTACRRRRAIFEDSGIEESIAASPKEEIEASVIPEEKMMREVVEPELLSSQVEAEEEKGLFLQASKTARFLNSVTVQTTTTKSTTVTIVTFTTSSFTKTLALATGASVLVCLPSGIITCA